MLTRLRARNVGDESRFALVAISVAFVFAVVIANFNVALERRYTSVYFWTLLGLALVFATMPGGAPGAPAKARGAHGK